MIPAQAWYVVHTKPRQEFRACEHLAWQGFRCHLPLLRVERIRRRARIWSEEPLFARYLFVALGADANWSVLRSTRGVNRLVEFGGVPACLPGHWVEAFLACEHASVQRLFAPGDRVRVTDGPLAGLEGVFKLPDGEARAIVLLDMLGRACRAKLPLESLRRAA